jgi:hypothetical protein
MEGEFLFNSNKDVSVDAEKNFKNRVFAFPVPFLC